MGNRRTTYVALLRGVNVGGRNRLAMADLRAILESLGHAHVRTYIQSGNAIFTSDAPGGAGAETALRARSVPGSPIVSGSRIDVIVRSRDDLAEALAAVPFRAADPKRLLVAFLAETPSADARRALELIEAAPESARVIGRTAYLDLPDGVGRSVLAPQFERRLKVRATARNLDTVRTLLAMADAPPEPVDG